ncbi:MAG: exo-alpha-sialidase, partial [Betaproteobacteria bacterium]|nr:exo-alpha-sialidase [Betaproteobacteria bacterium]
MIDSRRVRTSVAGLIGFLLPVVLGSCSGGGGGSPPAPAPTPVPTPAPPSTTVVVTAVNGLISAPSVFTANCGAPNTGTLYTNAEVEPHIALNPANPNNLIASWQQDRWSNGGAQGNTVAASLNGGQTWTLQPVKASTCGGGNAANNGNYERATDPWVAFSPNGTAYQMSLAISGASFQAGSQSAMLVYRSTDGGITWGPPATLVLDGATAFNDKNTLTADPTDSRFVYAVWDRLTNDNRGPTLFARTTDGGTTWETVRTIYDPGTGAQTIGNVIGVLPNGTLINLF